MSLHGVGRDGELRLSFEQRDGRTILTENYSRPPLQVMRAIEDRAGCLGVYALSPTGGVVQGDRYAIKINVGAGSHALFTTQAATKVYRMPNGCAEQTIRIDVQAGAVFEFVPDAAILFADADLTQQIEVRLHGDALLILHEIVLPGRIARGERLQFRRYANRLIVRDDRGLLLHDAAAIQPAATDLDALGVLEGYTAWGSAYLLGDLASRGIDADGVLRRSAGFVRRRRRDRRDLGALSQRRRRKADRPAVGDDLRGISRAARAGADAVFGVSGRAAAEMKPHPLTPSP